MTYVVTEACIKCKYTDCVEVCPVDCFYEGENMLVIHPDECIDCGVCVAHAVRCRKRSNPLFSGLAACSVHLITLCDSANHRRARAPP